jgi:hypothetical protein
VQTSSPQALSSFFPGVAIVKENDENVSFDAQAELNLGKKFQ